MPVNPHQQPNAIGCGGREKGRQRFHNVSSIKCKKGKVIYNGVDLTDTTKYFTPEEFSKIGNEGRRYLSNDKKRREYRQDNSPAVKRKDTEDMNHQVAAIVNGVIQATRNKSMVYMPNTVGISSTRTPSLPPMSQHGPHTRPPPTIISQVQKKSNSSVASAVTYDHNGSIVYENQH